MSARHALLLDSNVWSHLILGLPDKQARVLAGLGALLQKYPGATLATSQMCIAECMVGARRLPDPLQRQAAQSELEHEFSKPDLVVVQVTSQVLDWAATLRADSLRRVTTLGGPLPGVDGGKLKLPDAAIAASCLDFSPPAVLVTENVADFLYLEDGVQKTVAGLVVEKIG
ncbi:type II toxin-antitoxin system VapC family toxin [Rhodoferax sp.]|uniref:type II toxin-antitoxin system VapC family toxin n=1 Tax=Rhodoferax sp. TaxID=50421 RepID=UPI00263A3599|nr:type II toxin-antitoxin system VapC family toxin [Rhodoferax sp.]MDD5481072.1 type II toxin-antitoxin system VapC family toxin [Rhodoferax sp.]